jgi:PAS domain S-box-containing protein
MNQMFGYTKNDLLQSIVPFIATDYLKKTRRLFMKAVKGEIQKYETAGINKNGDRVYVKVTHLPIKVQGEIVGVYGVAKDITKQKEKEEELRRTKELLESLFQHSADCIAIISLDGIIQDVNSACSNMYGWEPDELKGKFFQVIPEDRMEELQTVFKNIKRGQEVVGLETIRMKKDGSLFDVSVTFSPLKDAEGNIIGLTAISRDISERKRTEELLSRTDKLSAIGQLAASVAHEIRNPLTSIKGFIQLFQGNIREQFVELMLSELARIEMIVTEFLLLAKPQSINFGEKDVTTIIFHTLAIMESQALMNKVEVIPILAADIPDIRCDENKIKQVLINVLKNALEAMPKGGKVHIYTEQQHEEILIRITDDGYGIPKERIKKLGEPFYSNKEKGTGLGLMVCYKIIEEHQGRIIIESEEGMGTSVNIYLPVHVEE